jgi:hypothetical protein
LTADGHREFRRSTPEIAARVVSLTDLLQLARGDVA